jgi:hypothetical protein
MAHQLQPTHKAEAESAGEAALNVAYDAQVQARKKLYAEVDKRPEGPTQVKCVRVGNSQTNVPI